VDRRAPPGRAARAALTPVPAAGLCPVGISIAARAPFFRRLCIIIDLT